MDAPDFWHLPIDQLYSHFQTRPEGLSRREAEERLERYGPNSLKPPQRGRGIILFLSQFKSPLILLLIGAAILSFSLGAHLDGSIICTIVGLSGILGFFQEYGALNALEKLLQLVAVKVAVVREGKEEDVSVDRIVPGDIVVLRAGDLIPADCILLDAKNLYVDEATLTGESLPVEKSVGDKLFMGTMVSSGVGSAMAAATGRNTEYSKIADKVRFRPPETAFETGVKKFGFFLLWLTLVFVGIIFVFNIIFEKPIIDSFLFSLAIAVGLTPQLLPAIITVNLTHGARRMAKKKVVVKRLAAIENFGQMDILCSDKTGTVTEGKIHFERAVDSDGNESGRVLFYGYLNACTQSGYTNPLDQAILQAPEQNTSGWNKTDEIPYDFDRKRLSVIFEHEGQRVLIAKGAVPSILSICSQIEYPDGSLGPFDESRERIERAFEEQSEQGMRMLAVAYGDNEREENLIFMGFLYFLDPIKPEIGKAIEEMNKKGVRLKILTGDHHAVAGHIAAAIGMKKTDLITGGELQNVDEEALKKIVTEKDVFAEIHPNQKEKIIQALKKAGHVVGYLGDGVNDVSALHSADVSIAVDSGADAAKEAADIVLLEKNYSVLREGIEEGRRTFSNTMKYIYMATSANFGNMCSMAGVSLFISYLPLLPKQVLLNNFLSDLPEMALATDRVDPEIQEKPVKWNLPFIKRFMIVFGILSSIPDFLTFGVLLYWLKADMVAFRTGWFFENIITASLVVLMIRTHRFAFRSKPGRLLLISVFAVAIGVVFLPYTPMGDLFGFAPMPLAFYPSLLGIVAFYLISVEIAKHFFFKHHRKQP